jgi:GINS complex subunit 1
MGICDDGSKLVKEAKRNLTKIRPYDDQNIRNITHTIQDRYSDLEKLIESGNSQSHSYNQGSSSQVQPSSNQSQFTLSNPYIKYLTLVLKRLKRALLIYFNTRMRSLLPLIWQDSSQVLSESATTSDPSNRVHTNLNITEVEFSKKYHKLISELNLEFPSIELMGDINPPKKVIVEVRVLEDAGSIMTEFGMVNLIKDSQILVRLSDVEGLISRGLVERID